MVYIRLIVASLVSLAMMLLAVKTQVSDWCVSIRVLLVEGDIGVFGFTVLVIFEIGFPVVTLKMSGFSVFLFVVVFGFFLF